MTLFDRLFDCLKLHERKIVVLRLTESAKGSCQKGQEDLKTPQKFQPWYRHPVIFNFGKIDSSK